MAALNMAQACAQIIPRLRQQAPELLDRNIFLAHSERSAWAILAVLIKTQQET
jgi:hypothetical protein